jgi:dCMP deaminase
MNTIIAYVPVLHAGYVRFFEKYGGNLYLIDPSVVPEVEYLVRDLRALDVHDMCDAIYSLNVFKQITVLDQKNLLSCDHFPSGKIILPDEDVSQQFVQKYLPNRSDVVFDSIFLRWNWGNVTSAHRVSADASLTYDDFHQHLMAQAYRASQQSPDWWRQVGALVMKNGEVLDVFYNEHLPTSAAAYAEGDPRTPFNPGERIDLSLALHAEAAIVSWAALKGISLRGASVYVTTFPCPGCARLLARSGIHQVYFSEGYSLLDAEDIFRHFGVEIIHVEMSTTNPP